MGSNNSAEKAQKAADEAEKTKQQGIDATTSRINSIYDSSARQNQYQDFINAVRSDYTADAQKQKTVADRNLKFSMARNGLTGGSASVDANRTLGQEYQEGLLSAENKAQGALSDLKSQDESSRLNLIQLAQQGLDATTAASRANSATQAAAQTSKSDALASGLGDVFGQTSKTYQAQQDAAAKRQALLAPTTGSLYGTPGW